LGHFTSITLTLEGSLQIRTNLHKGCFGGHDFLTQQDDDIFIFAYFLKYFFSATSSEGVNLLAESDVTL
jgi:hypothetical protein